MLKRIKNRRLSRQETPVEEIVPTEEEADLALEGGDVSAQKMPDMSPAIVRVGRRGITAIGRGGGVKIKGISGQENTQPIGQFGIIDPTKREARKNVAKGYAIQACNVVARALGQPEKIPPTGISEAN